MSLLLRCREPSTIRDDERSIANMKLHTLVTIVIATVGLAAAQPHAHHHQHHHHHHHERAAAPQLADQSETGEQGVSQDSAPSHGSISKAPFTVHAAQGIDAELPDGELNCSDFPDQYGAMSIHWLDLDGWSGIQKPNSFTGGFGDIETVKSGGCTEGAYCSYACPMGYQKSQWPETQGSTGQSVGGLQCKNGKLWLTNKAMSTKLCMTGTQEVEVTVQNKMISCSAICRTDYPGKSSNALNL